VISAIKTMAAEQVGTQWKRATVLGHNDLQTEDYLEAYKTILEMDTPIEVIDDHIRVSTSARIQLSLMKSLMPIIREVNTFESTMAKQVTHQDSRLTQMPSSPTPVISSWPRPASSSPGSACLKGMIAASYSSQGVLNHTGELYAMSMANEMDSVLRNMTPLNMASVVK